MGIHVLLQGWFYLLLPYLHPEGGGGLKTCISVETSSPSIYLTIAVLSHIPGYTEINAIYGRVSAVGQNIENLDAPAHFCRTARIFLRLPTLSDG
jgi:hypothetical protein